MMVNEESSVVALIQALKEANTWLKYCLERRKRARANNMSQKFKREQEVIVARKRVKTLEDWLTGARKREWEERNRE